VPEEVRFTKTNVESEAIVGEVGKALDKHME
jgi:hypothetical protein